MGTNGVRPPSRTAELSLQCVQDSIRWFGDTVTDTNAIPHHTLALAGEVGELANIVKKIDRGSLNGRAPVVRHMMAMELTDVFIYVLNLAGIMGIDLEEAYKIKRAENEQRFSKEREARDARTV
jgi:NTP pyrophosphatase (non-canonical NTP hydrolase)